MVLILFDFLAPGSRMERLMFCLAANDSVEKPSRLVSIRIRNLSTVVHYEWTDALRGPQMSSVRAPV